MPQFVQAPPERMGIERRADEAELARRLEERARREAGFERRGHTHRHSLLYTLFERHVVRPSLKLGLQALGLYERGRRNALSPVVRNVELGFDSLPPVWDGLRILHISDLHIEGTPGLVEALSGVLASAEADICLLTGDYRFESYGSSAGVYPLLKRLLGVIRARFGVVGILGNHDATESVAALEGMGVRMLVNEAVALGEGEEALWIAGVDDPFDYQTHDLQRALRDVPREAFKILLAHAPELYEEASQAGVNLYLSGHTHAGQIRVPVLGALKQNASCPAQYGYGLWEHGGMTGYTSAGAGCSSLPVRFNCPPEVVLLTLRRDG